MKPMTVPLRFSAVVFLAATAATSVAADASRSLAELQGQWFTQKTNKEGQPFFQTLEVKQDRLNFKIIDADQQIRFVARGKLKADPLGPFDSFQLTSIEHGRAESDLQPTDETLSYVYQLRDGHWIIAANFDRFREDRPPSLETYSRGTPPASKASAPPPSDLAAKLIGEWKMDVTFGENTSDYSLRFSRGDNNAINGTLVSPRSGEYKFKSVLVQGAEVVMEITRNFDGNDVPFLYKGSLKGNNLEGTVVVKGFENQYSGTWKASR